jgi:hypothetical protein
MRSSWLMRRGLVVFVALLTPLACSTVAGLPDLTYEPNEPNADAGHVATDARESDGTADTAVIDGAPSTGPTLGGCPMFPVEDEWNRDVSADAVDPDSAAMIAAMSPGTALHANWGTTTQKYGNSFAIVPGSQPLLPMVFEQASTSDPGPYPIPLGLILSSGNQHVSILQQDTCVLFEFRTLSKDASGPGYHGYIGAKWDLRSTALRADGMEGIPVSGMPLLPGLVRTDELELKQIRHALAFDLRSTRKNYVHPATLTEGTSTNAHAPPLGLRVRLKKSFDTTGFGPGTLVIVEAMKRYGMFLVDQSTDWYIEGAMEDRWSTDYGTIYEDFLKIHGSDFEVLTLGSLR